MGVPFLPLAGSPQVNQNHPHQHQNKAESLQHTLRHFQYLSDPGFHFIWYCKIGNTFNDHDHTDNAQEKFHCYPFFIAFTCRFLGMFYITSIVIFFNVHRAFVRILSKPLHKHFAYINSCHTEHIKNNRYIGITLHRFFTNRRC